MPPSRRSRLLREILSLALIAGDVCYLSKYAGAPADAMVIVTKTNVAWEKVKEINAAVDKVLQADLAKRAKIGMADESRAENDRPVQIE